MRVRRTVRVVRGSILDRIRCASPADPEAYSCDFDVTLIMVDDPPTKRGLLNMRRGSILDETIHPREPQLIKLPIPLPSIPVLSPILAPIIGGSDQNNNPGTTTSASTPAPDQSTSPPVQPTLPPVQPTLPPAQPTPSPAQPTPPPAQLNPPASPPPSNGGGASPPANSGSGSPGPVAPIVAPGSGTNFGDTSPSGNSDDSSATDTDVTPSGITDGASPSSVSLLGDGGDIANTGSNINLGSDANDPSFPAGGGVANAGGVPIPAQGTASRNSGGSNTIAGGSPSPTAGNHPNNTVVSAAEKGHSIPVGAIAAIVIICVALFLALLIFFLRRRSRARRKAQANTWWFSRKRTSKTYADRNSAEILVAGSQSARNSFAASPTIPRPPPMAEVGRVTASSLQAIIDKSRYTPEVPNNRDSVISGHSEDSQFLFVNIRNSCQLTPSASRELSPISQAFAFPKPPSPVGDRASAYSRPSSHHGTLRAIMRRPNSNDSLFSSFPPVPTPPAAVSLIGEDPFASDPFVDNNPFENSQPTAAPAALKDIIRRPYQRVLQDEITVSVGECVHVLTTFDDGWAYVVKVPVPGSGGEDNENVSGGNKGLIPINCLRESDEDLSAFIAAKRLSSYSTEATFTAL